MKSDIWFYLGYTTRYNKTKKKNINGGEIFDT